MILFALCIEPLLRHLRTWLGPKDGSGSFADDIGIVVQNSGELCPRTTDFSILGPSLLSANDPHTYLPYYLWDILFPG